MTVETGVTADCTDVYIAKTNGLPTKDAMADNEPTCRTCVLHHPTGVSSGKHKKVEAVSLGGRDTGSRLTDSYTKGPCVTGVDADTVYGSATVEVEKPNGIYTHSDKALAGVMTNTTTVVLTVEGKIATENVVKEFYAADAVNPPNSTGVNTCGVGMDATCTAGAEKSYKIEHLATLD